MLLKGVISQFYSITKLLLSFQMCIINDFNETNQQQTTTSACSRVTSGYLDSGHLHYVARSCADELNVNKLLNVSCEIFGFKLRHFTQLMERQRRRRVERQKNGHQE